MFKLVEVDYFLVTNAYCFYKSISFEAEDELSAFRSLNQQEFLNLVLSLVTLFQYLQCFFIQHYYGLVAQPTVDLLIMNDE